MHIPPANKKQNSLTPLLRLLEQITPEIQGRFNSNQFADYQYQQNEQTYQKGNIQSNYVYILLLVEEILKSSLNFMETSTEPNSIDEYIECSSEDSPRKVFSATAKEPLKTFTSYFSENKHYPQKQFQSEHQQYSKQVLHENENLQNQKPKPYHKRGPSRIKDIMASLKAGVLFDLQKIANDLLSDPFLHQQIELNSTGKSQYDSQRISFSEGQIFSLTPAESVRSSRYKEEPIEQPSKQADQDQRREIQNDQKDPCITQNQRPKVRSRSRKQSRLRKGSPYCLDIIQEQSYEYLTPEKLIEYEEQFQSLPCFGTQKVNQSNSNVIKSKSQKEVQYIRRNHFIQILIKQKSVFTQYNDSIASHQSSQPIIRKCQSEYSGHSNENDTANTTYPVIPTSNNNIIDDIDWNQERMNSEEEAILASWNNLCTEIIRNNLLPISFNLDRIQHNIEHGGKSNLQSKLLRARRRVQRLNYLSEMSKVSENDSDQAIQLRDDHTQEDSQNNSLREDQSVVVVSMAQRYEESKKKERRDQNQFDEKSPSDLQIEEVNEQDLNFQFSPNFSDICKRIQFTSGSFRSQEDLKRQGSFMKVRANKENIPQDQANPRQPKLRKLSFVQYRMKNND